VRIGVYDPYLDTLGGGERYMLTLAAGLSDRHEVTVFWDDASILEKAKAKLGIDLAGVSLRNNIFRRAFLSKYIALQEYDVLFFLSDGSIPTLLSKKNFLLFQFPRQTKHGISLADRVKLLLITKVLYNSSFVMKSYDHCFGRAEEVIYPPVLPVTGSEKKEDIILNVGRFTTGMNVKKQEELISAFKEGFSKKNKGWKLVLIGSVLPTDREYLDSLRRMADGLAIELLENPTREVTETYFKKAKVYWHAAGIGEDLLRYPERAEHFGIAIVEAMSSGCVPIVFNGGGVSEIIESGKNGFLFSTKAELIRETDRLIKDTSLMKSLAVKAVKDAEKYSDNRFVQAIHALL
jgi:glycosyltransferase involved in cell wall biosynthesis